MENAKTAKEFDAALACCRAIFRAKLDDYGASWRILRPISLTDQIFIKAKRIRTLETIGESRVGDGIQGEFMAIVNYGLMGVIQLSLPEVTSVDISNGKALELYDKAAATARTLMLAKNHDYGEAWRDMRVSSYTDLILTKIQRTKEIERHGGRTTVSEGIESNYLDMVNYALFGIIQLTEADETLK